MCQLVATLIHLFLCRYECQNFGFWGAFLAVRFCVYITQMNFLFCPFSYLILSYLIPICYASILPLFVCFSILLLLCSFTAFSFFSRFVLLLLIRSFAPSYFVRWDKCRFVT